MINDLRIALRLLLRSPGFSGVAVATLAIAIGVNASIFSVVNSLVLRPVVPLHPSELVNIFTARKGARQDFRQFSYPEFQAARARNPIFSDVAALGFGMTGIGREGAIRRSLVFFTSENMFSLLGASPAAGRFYDASESRPDADIPVAVASYELWQRMGGRPDFVGSRLDVDGRPFTVIGVAPRAFTGTSALVAPDLWLPLGVYGRGRLGSMFDPTLASRDLASPSTFSLNLTGRLRPGLSISSAAPMLPALGKRMEAVSPPGPSHSRELLIQHPSRFSLSTNPSDDASIWVIAGLLAAMAAVVLVIACLNLANMMLARGTARRREFAIRLSIGAPRWRIVRQLLVEGLVLSLAGGCIGLVFAEWCNDLLAGSLGGIFRTMSLSFAVDVHPDAMAVAVTVLFCLGATLSFSLGPAMASVRTDLVGDLKAQPGDAPAGHGWNRFFSPRHCLVMVQISLCLVLLVAGGLFLRGAMRASGLKLGFDPSGVLVAEVDYSMAQGSDAQAQQRLRDILVRARELPGVRYAGLTSLQPYANVMITRRIAPSESAPRSAAGAADAGESGVYAGVTPGFFDALAVRLEQGRAFTDVEADATKAAPVVILDEKMAHQLFPKGGAVGRHVRVDGGMGDAEVVGIVAPSRQEPGSGEPSPRIYVPLAQVRPQTVYLDVRFATTDPRALAASMASLRRAMLETDSNLPLVRLLPFSQIMSGDIVLWAVDVGGVIFAVFGFVALVLASVGVYGVKAYSVARRTREIGIRVALGAKPADVIALVLRQAVQQMLFALAVGGILAVLMGRALASALFNVSPLDPAVFGVSAIVLAATTLLACWLPAARAARVNPVDALRIE